MSTQSIERFKCLRATLTKASDIVWNASTDMELTLENKINLRYAQLTIQEHIGKALFETEFILAQLESLQVKGESHK
jgi:hypothetical protein